MNRDVLRVARAAKRFEEDSGSIMLVHRRVKAKTDYEQAKVRCAALHHERNVEDEKFCGLPDWHHGWSLWIVGALTVAALFFEAYPSWMSSLALLESGTVALVLLASAFAIFGALLGGVSGALLRKFREPESRQPLDIVFIWCLGALTFIYLFAVGMLRVRYALMTVGGTESAVMAGIALTVLAAVGMTLACLGGYKSETMECFALRRHMNRVQSSIAAAERDLGLREGAFNAADLSARQAIQAFVASDPELANQSDDTINNVIRGLLQDDGTLRQSSDGDLSPTASPPAADDAASMKPVNE